MRPNPVKERLLGGTPVFGTMAFEFFTPGLPQIDQWDPSTVRGAVELLGAVADRLPGWRIRLEAIGRELGITRARVRQIEAAALERLAVHRELDAVSDAAA